MCCFSFNNKQFSCAQHVFASPTLRQSIMLQLYACQTSLVGSDSLQRLSYLIAPTYSGRASLLPKGLSWPDQEFSIVALLASCALPRCSLAVTSAARLSCLQSQLCCVSRSRQYESAAEHHASICRSHTGMQLLCHTRLSTGCTNGCTLWCQECCGVCCGHSTM